MYCPDEVSYEQFCRLVRSKHEQEHRTLKARADAAEARVSALERQVRDLAQAWTDRAAVLFGEWSDTPLGDLKSVEGQVLKRCAEQCRALAARETV